MSDTTNKHWKLDWPGVNLTWGSCLPDERGIVVLSESRIEHLYRIDLCKPRLNERGSDVTEWNLVLRGLGYCEWRQLLPGPRVSEQMKLAIYRTSDLEDGVYLADSLVTTMRENGLTYLLVSGGRVRAATQMAEMIRAWMGLEESRSQVVERLRAEREQEIDDRYERMRKRVGHWGYPVLVDGTPKQRAKADRLRLDCASALFDARCDGLRFIHMAQDPKVAVVHAAEVLQVAVNALRGVEKGELLTFASDGTMIPMTGIDSGDRIVGTALNSADKDGIVQVVMRDEMPSQSEVRRRHEFPWGIAFGVAGGWDAHALSDILATPRARAEFLDCIGRVDGLLRASRGARWWVNTIDARCFARWLLESKAALPVGRESYSKSLYRDLLFALIQPDGIGLRRKISAEERALAHQPDWRVLVEPYLPGPDKVQERVGVLEAIEWDLDLRNSLENAAREMNARVWDEAVIHSLVQPVVDAYLYRENGGV